MSDEFVTAHQFQKDYLKTIFTEGDYIRILNFIEYVCRHPRASPYFSDHINFALAEAKAPYRMMDKSIVAYVSDEEGAAVAQAVELTANNKFASARSHLIAAGRELALGNWADSVRESIHAVESVAVLVDPTSKTLSAALQKLEKAERINPNFKRGVNALYDYTSDEKGIRHAKIFEDEVNVGETEALYMFGSCASFVTYLIRKADNVA